MAIAGIYKITNVINQRFYYGQSQNLSVRWDSHARALMGKRHGNKHMRKDFIKYGSNVNDWKFEIIVYCDEVCLDFYEQRFLDKFHDNQVMCYNISKYASSVMRGRSHSEETKQRMSEERKGEKNPCYGKTISEERKQKLSLERSGVNNHNYGKKHSEAARKAMSEANKGKCVSLETRKKLSENSGSKRKVVVIELNTNNRIAFNSIKEAAKYCGISFRCISDVLSGRCKTAKRKTLTFI